MISLIIQILNFPKTQDYYRVKYITVACRSAVRDQLRSLSIAIHHAFSRTNIHKLVLVYQIMCGEIFHHTSHVLLVVKANSLNALIAMNMTVLR